MEDLENNQEYDIKLDDIIFDFISSLDEAIATFKVLEELKKEHTRPNQLLFCHIINSFDSFINTLLKYIIFSDKETLKEYFYKNNNKNLDDKPTLRDIININENGILEWMKEQNKKTFEEELRRKRHSQKLESLFEKIKIDSKKLYVFLTGPGKYASGNIKNKPTSKNKWTVNHKTTPENIIGYADLLYEKRNAVTHNGNNYPDKTIIRLNQDWKVTIERKLVLIKRSTIKSLIRFYTSIGLEIINNNKITNLIEMKDYRYKSYLEDLNIFKNIILTKIIKSANDDDRYAGGGIIERKDLLIESKVLHVKVNDYARDYKISYSTANRDFKEFEKIGLLTLEQRGCYKVNIS